MQSMKINMTKMQEQQSSIEPEYIVTEIPKGSRNPGTWIKVFYSGAYSAGRINWRKPVRS